MNNTIDWQSMYLAEVERHRKTTRTLERALDMLGKAMGDESIADKYQQERDDLKQRIWLAERASLEQLKKAGGEVLALDIPDEAPFALKIIYGGFLFRIQDIASTLIDANTPGTELAQLMTTDPIGHQLQNISSLGMAAGNLIATQDFFSSFAALRNNLLGCLEIAAEHNRGDKISLGAVGRIDLKWAKNNIVNKPDEKDKRGVTLRQLHDGLVTASAYKHSGKARDVYADEHSISEGTLKMWSQWLNRTLILGASTEDVDNL